MANSSTNNPSASSTSHVNHDAETQRLTQLAQKTALPRNPNRKTPEVSKTELAYDIFMLAVIIFDLILIGLDLILMSAFAEQVGSWLGMTHFLHTYSSHWHDTVRFVGGLITLFLIVELSIRWGIAIIKKRYLRWFFFPFIHWYEVLGCFPQLRALRLLRAVFIGRKLYQMGVQVLPEKWIDTGRFYYALILEELSDRVILTATDNMRQQFAGKHTKERLLEQTLDKNRHALQATLASMLHQELAPKLKELAHGPVANQLAHHVGASVQDALANTDELRRYLRMIPIAGRLIESELHTIGAQLGENLVDSLSQRLTNTDFIDPFVNTLAHSIASIEVDNPELDALIAQIVNDSLSAFEAQIKVQQWKHHEQLQL